MVNCKSQLFFLWINIFYDNISLIGVVYMSMYVEEIREELIFCLRRISNDLYIMQDNSFSACDEFFLKIEEAFDNNKDDLKSIFDFGYTFGPYFEDKSRMIPFYVYMEIIVETLRTRIKNKHNKEKVDSLIAKFKEYREKTKAFSIDKRFDPEKHIDERFVENLMNSRGKIELYNHKEYPDFLMVKFDTSTELHRMRKDGEYEPVGVVNSENKSFFYMESQEEYKRLLKEKHGELKEMYSQVFERYFVGGELPMYSLIDDNLINKDISSDIRDTFKQLALSKKDYGSGMFGELEWMKANIINIKFILRQEEKAKLDEEEAKKIKVVEVKDEPAIVKRAKREILKDMFKLFKELIGIVEISDKTQKKKQITLDIYV